MKVVRGGETPREESLSPLFTGAVQMQSVLGPRDDSELNLAFVHFPQGVRNKLHRHSTDQVLVVTDGRGIVATEDEEVEIAEGDIVHAPAGEKHWHGAGSETAMTHLTITPRGSEVEQLDP